MKQLLILLFINISAQSIAQQTTLKEAWLEKWENSKDYLIGIAETMPEEFYDFKPTQRQMSFKEQLMHIKGNMDWLSTTYFTALDFDKNSKEMPKSKEETIALITKAFDNTHKIIAAISEESLTDTVSFFAGDKSKIQILNLLQDHVTHHRGQLIVYLNLKNLEPPKFVGW